MIWNDGMLKREVFGSVCELRANVFGLCAATFLGLGLVLAILYGLDHGVVAAMHNVVVEPVIVTAVHRCEVHINDDPTSYATVQAAINAAADGDTIKIAGYCEGGTLVISKSLTLRGGYAAPNWSVTDPQLYPTTLAAQGASRVLHITEEVSVTLAGLRITGGNATSLDPTMWPRGAGGGVYAISATVTLVDSQVFHNAAYCGGGIGVVNASLVLSRSWIFSNTAMDSGGGVCAVNPIEYGDSDGQGPPMHIAILSSQIFSNTAADSGGGVYVENSFDPFEGYGGRIEAVINDNRIFANVAEEGDGGGLSLYNSSALLANNIITGNRASFTGGGLALGRCIFCGGLNAVSRLYGNSFMLNQASRGGGLYLAVQFDLFGDRNLIISNTADYGGGGYLRFSGGVLSNTVVVNNRAHHTGSGLYLARLRTHFLHTTIANNQGGDSSGICVAWDPWSDSIFSPSWMTMTNTIIASQTVGITNSLTFPGIATTLHGVLWSGNSVNVTSTVPITVTHAHTGAVAFAADGYHLTANSAAIDQGVDTALSLDIDGEARPAGVGYDLGADEFQAGLRISIAAQAGWVRAGEQVTYTLCVTNIGNIDLRPIITDMLPLPIVLGRTSRGTVLLPGEKISWRPFLTARGDVWTETIVVTTDVRSLPSLGYAGPISNVLTVTTPEGVGGTETEVTRIYGTVYLPVLLRSALEIDLD